MKHKITIIGAGSFGTSLAVLLAAAKHSVTLWGRSVEAMEDLRRRRENAKYLPGIRLDGIEFSSAERLDADLFVMAVPTQHVRSVLDHLKPSSSIPVVSLSKGIEMNTLARPSQILSAHPVCVLSGPSHALEVARFAPTSVVAASHDPQLARRVQEIFWGPSFRVYTSDDVVGVEFAGALKNVIAIAAGICDGLKLGDNAKAALISRGLVEVSRFGICMGGRESTFFGLAGLGDLVTTCFSPLGRNLRVGREIGSGKSLDQVLASMQQVAEGVWTSRAALGLAKQRALDMPITQEVAQVLFEGKSSQAALRDLMTRPPTAEFETRP